MHVMQRKSRKVPVQVQRQLPPRSRGVPALRDDPLVGVAQDSVSHPGCVAAAVAVEVALRQPARTYLCAAHNALARHHGAGSTGAAEAADSARRDPAQARWQEPLKPFHCRRRLHRCSKRRCGQRELRALLCRRARTVPLLALQVPCLQLLRRRQPTIGRAPCVAARFRVETRVAGRWQGEAWADECDDACESRCCTRGQQLARSWRRRQRQHRVACPFSRRGAADVHELGGERPQAHGGAGRSHRESRVAALRRARKHVAEPV